MGQLVVFDRLVKILFIMLCIEFYKLVRLEFVVNLDIVSKVGNFFFSVCSCQWGFGLCYVWYVVKMNIVKIQKFKGKV